MPEKEFELYLSMLAKMLRLSAKQRESVADELRDHLETRLTELMESGLTRDDAIRLAMEDMGDAAGLASRLSTVATLRRRRMIVRGTLVSACVLFVGLIAAGLFTPDHAVVAPQPLVAQAPPPTPAQPNTTSGFPGVPGMASRAVLPKGETLRRETEAKLEETCAHDVDFSDIPFRDSVGVLSESMGLPILIDELAITEEGTFTLDSPVTLKLPGGVATYRTILDLLLRKVGGSHSKFAFDAREGLLHLTRESESLIVDVYNVRDLIGLYDPNQEMGMSGGMGGEAAGGMAMGGSAPGMMAGGMPGMPGGMPGMGAPPTRPAEGQASTSPVYSEKGRPLVLMIVGVLEPAMWTISGGDSSIGEVNGLLVVRTTTRMHRSLTDLLSKMRTAKAAGAGLGFGAEMGRAFPGGGGAFEGSAAGFGPGMSTR